MKKTNLLVKAAIAGIIAGGSAGFAAGEGKFPCYKGNTCKGQGACGAYDAKGNFKSSCHGSNPCAAQGFIKTKDAAACEVAKKAAAVEAKKQAALKKKKKS